MNPKEDLVIKKSKEGERFDFMNENNNLYNYIKDSFAANKKFIIPRIAGVENNVAAGSSQSTLIGDVNVEYLLNEQGTFRVSIFNESNNYTVIQEKDAGQFTQGVGIQYQEEFNNLRDFQLFQFVIDVFRKDKKISKKKNSRQKPVPAKTNGSGVLPDEK
jgi:hypothetical protein